MATNAGRHLTPLGNAPPRPDKVWIPDGAFRMGSDDFYPEERPLREVRVAGFWMDRHPVTNQQFARFVAATGYVTVAEQRPDPALYPGAPPENLVAGSMVFVPTLAHVDLTNHAQWWAWTPGADWRHPQGPHTGLDGLANHPVVHVAFRDAAAYCAWAEAALPTEAEWEYAARGGRDGATYTWGDEERPGGVLMANYWQGQFPWLNTQEDGFLFTSPVGSFPANGYGLLDMAGNVWEWTADWYSPPSAQFRIPRRVVKGGSHLCAPSYCFRYRPAARLPQDIDTGTSHIGFRCIVRAGTGRP